MPLLAPPAAIAQTKATGTDIFVVFRPAPASTLERAALEEQLSVATKVLSVSIGTVMLAQGLESRLKDISNTVRAGARSHTWLSTATAAFPNSRSLAPQERTELDTLYRRTLHPLSQPLRKLPNV
jgi:hypothetical protein